MIAINAAELRTSYGDRSSIYFRFRQARALHVQKLIDQIFFLKGEVAILDLGGEETYWRVFPQGYLKSRNTTITLLNLHPPCSVSKPFVSLQGNATDTGMPDGSFDLVHSNSVIEHVGSQAAMLRFAGEVRRLAPSYFIQTPNFWFPFEPHMRMPMIHWLPLSMQAYLVRLLQLNAEGPIETVNAAREYLSHNRLISYAGLRKLLPDAEILSERYAGMTKSLMAIRQPRRDPSQLT